MKRKLIFFRGEDYEEIVDIFWGQLQIGLFWGHFYTFYGFFKTKVQNGNVLGDHKKFQVFFFFFFGGGGGMPDIPIFRVGGGVNSGCMKKN